MPNPASSGTGYLMVSAWLQMMGEEKGWAFMDKLHQNIASYTHSGSKPCKQAAAGEYSIGLSFEYRANSIEGRRRADRHRASLRGARLGHGSDGHHGTTTKNSDDAKKLADWAATKDANELYAKNYAIVAHAGRRQAKLEFIPVDIEPLLIKNDFTWAAAESRPHPRPSGRSATTPSPNRRAEADRQRAPPPVSQRGAVASVAGVPQSHRDRQAPICRSAASPSISDHFTALDDIDLDIQRGEFVSFLGPSGCGKTTLLRAISGLDVADDRDHRQAGARHLAPACRRSVISASSSSPTRCFPI